MPSGPKRRKAAAAAKKKQDKGSNFHTSSTVSPENDDPKIVEGDDVEVSSDEKRGDLSVRSIVDEKTLKEDADRDDGKSVVTEDYDGGAVLDGGGVNGEEESESKNVGAVNDEFAKNRHNRSSSSSNSSSRHNRSSSDDDAHVVEELADESQVVEKNSLELVDESHDTKTGPLALEGESQVVEKSSLALEDESHNTKTGPLALEDESRVTDKDPLESENSEILNNEGESLVPGATTVSDSVVETEPLADSVKLDETILEKVIPLAQIYPLETSVISDVVELGTSEKDGHFTDYAKDDQAIEDAKDGHDETDNTSAEEAHHISVTETAPIVDSIKLDDPVLEKVIPITGTNEKDDQLFPSLVENENYGTFRFVTDIEAEKVEDKALYKNEGGSSSANAPITGTKDYGEYIKSIEVSECSEKQPLIDHPREQVQKASWKNCCGLFDW